MSRTPIATIYAQSPPMTLPVRIVHRSGRKFSALEDASGQIIAHLAGELAAREARGREIVARMNGGGA